MVINQTPSKSAGIRHLRSLPSGGQLFLDKRVGIPPAPYRSLPTPSGRKSPKSLRKSLQGLPASGSKKCPKQSHKSLRSLKTVYFESLETLSRLFRALFVGPRGQKALGDSFGDSFGDSSGIPGAKGPGDSCKGRAGSQQKRIVQIFGTHVLGRMSFA